MTPYGPGNQVGHLEARCIGPFVRNDDIKGQSLGWIILTIADSPELQLQFPVLLSPSGLKDDVGEPVTLALVVNEFAVTQGRCEAAGEDNPVILCC